MLHLAVCGPPACGKSSSLALVGSAVSDGRIPFKIAVVDAEVLPFPFSLDSQKAFLSMLKLGKGNILLGCGGFDPLLVKASGFFLIAILPDEEAYVKLFRHKEQNRGVGAHTLSDSIIIYHSFVKLSASYDLVVPSPEVLLSLFVKGVSHGEK